MKVENFPKLLAYLIALTAHSYSFGEGGEVCVWCGVDCFLPKEA